MVKYFILALLLLILGANIYFFRSSSKEISSTAPEKYQTKEEILNDPELSLGMKQILIRREETSRGADNSDNFEDGPSSEINEEPEGMPPVNLETFAPQEKHLAKKHVQEQHRKDVSVLYKEIEKDQNIFLRLEESGDKENALRMKGQIEMKQEILEQLQNNPPREETDE